MLARPPVDALEISLSNNQLQQLAELAKRHHNSITIRNDGEDYLLLSLHNAAGDVVALCKLPYEGEMVPGLHEGEEVPSAPPRDSHS
jgi:hypothetical protein